MKIAPGTPLTVRLAWSKTDIQRVGRLALRDRQIFFQYDPSFLETGLDISPLKLPRVPEVQGPFQTPSSFEGLPGVFNDCLPDGWGRLLVDRRARELDVSLSALDRLAIVGCHGIGALTFEPITEIGTKNGTLDLDKLAADSRAVFAGEAGKVLDQLIRLGGSPHGARPKAMIAIDEKGKVYHGYDDDDLGFPQFLVKFAAKNDPKDIGAREYAYSLMAAAAGVRLPETRLLPQRGGPGYFASAHFDRVDGHRLHAHTISGVLHAEQGPTLDYVDILKTVLHLTRDQREIRAMFRLMTFNVLAHNRDDHGKQFTLLMGRDGSWRLAPAYDLTFSDGINGEHSTTVAGEGAAPGRNDVLAVAAKIGVPRAEAERILDEVASAIARWPEFAETAGVGRTGRAEIGRTLGIAPRCGRKKS